MRRVLPVVVVLAGLLAVPAGAAGATFNFGVAAGDVSNSSTLLWTRASTAGSFAVDVATDRAFRHVSASRRTTARSSQDFTMTVRTTGLWAATRYWYRFSQCETGTAGSSLACKRTGRPSAAGTFITAPSPSSSATIRFAYSGDADATIDPRTHRPGFGSFEVYRRMQLEGNLFNVNLGDTIYSDSEIPGTAIARTVAQKWAKYRQNLAQRNLSGLRAAAGMYNQWDDHEFINDFTKAENGTALYAAGKTAFLDYMPATFGRLGLYRTFRWGRNVQLFVLDERSFRSAKASANHACDNPQTGQPDLAPTAPSSTRSLFSALVPSLSQPVSQGCKDTINNPNRTMLGRAQLAAFERAIKTSNATWKIVVNEVPIQQFYALPYDRWEGYEAERKSLMDYLKANVRNAVFLTTDVHANFFNTIKFSALGENGPAQDTGIWDATTGPVGTGTFSQEIDDTTGNPNAGTLITNVFFKGTLQMACANSNIFSYAEVTATRRSLTVLPKDGQGRQVRDSVGPCKLTLAAR